MKGKKLVAFVLCLLMTVSMLPVGALAEGDGEEPAAPSDTPAVAAGETEGETGGEDAQPGSAEDDDPSDFDADAGDEDGEDPASPAVLTEQTGEGDPIAKEGDTYTVAGTAGAFGSNWDPENTGNDLTLGSNGKYSKTFTVTSRVDPCSFKVVKNHSWDNGSWPGENFNIKLIGAGTFTISFDPDSKDISVSGDIVYWPDEPFEMFIAGTWNSWNTTGTPMTRTDHYVWKTEVDLGTGDQAFKFTQGDWSTEVGANGDYTYEAFGSPYSTTSTGASNICFHANNGHYRIVYDSAGHTFTVSRLCNVTVTQPAEGTLTASASSGYSGTVITLTSNPAAASYAVNGTAMTGNTYTLSNEDVTFTATYASGQKYAIDISPIAANQRGTVEVKNSLGQTVTEAAEGEVLHFSVTPDAGYEAVKYSLYYNVYYNGPNISNCPIDQTFVMPDKKVYYSIVYFPEQSGYYWFVRNNPQPLSNTDLILSQVLSEDGDSGYYIAPTQLNSTGWLNVRYYDADTHTLGENYQHVITSSETGDVFVRFLPTGGVVSVARAITVVQPQQGGTISTLSCASAGDTVTVNTTAEPGYRFDSLTVTAANDDPVTVTGSTFRMPASSVTVTATFVPDVAHAIHVVSTPHGTTTVSTGSYQNVTEAQARKDDFVTVNVTPDQGYKKQVPSLAVLPSATGGVIPGLIKVDSASSTFFYMPDQDVWVSVNYVIANAGYYLCFKEDGAAQGTKYYRFTETAIDPQNLYQDANGSMYLTVEIPSAWEGKEAWTTYVNGNGQVWGLDIENGSGVTVPAGAAGTTARFHFQLISRLDSGSFPYVTGTTTLEYPYLITKEATVNGALSVAESAFAGDTVAITVTPDEGYFLRTLTVTDANDAPVLVTNNTFVMPAGDVTVAAEFTNEQTYPVKLNISVFSAGASTSHIATDAERAAIIDTLEFTPQYASPGETVNIHLVINPDYYIKTDLPGYDNTIVKVDDTHYSYVVPDPYSYAVVGFTVAVGVGLDEGYYAQIDNAATSQWIRLVNNYPFFGNVAGGSSLHSAKATLTAGQVLTAYHVSRPGETPVQKTTCDVAESGTQTIYYVAEGEDKLCVSSLTGYYLVHANVTSTWPYEITENEALTDRGGYYTYDGLFKGEHWICVAQFVDGTVEMTYPPKNDPKEVPRNEDNIVGFPYIEGGQGRARFYPDGDGENCNIVSGVLSVNHIYDISYSPAEGYTVTYADAIHAGHKAAGGEIVAFTATPDAQLEITGVTVVDAENDPVTVTAGENGAYSFAMPESGVTVTFSLASSFTITSTVSGCALTGLPASAGPGDPVEFTVTPGEGVGPHYRIRVSAVNASDGNAALEVTAGADNSYSFTMPNGNVAVTVQCVSEPDFWEKHALTLNTQIGVIFCVDFHELTPDDFSDCYVTFLVGAETTEQTAVVNKNSYYLVDGVKYYKFTCNINSLQMADEITPTFHGVMGSETFDIEGDPYAVKNYIDNYHDNPARPEKERNLLKALGDYGHYAQLYLKPLDVSAYGVHADMPAYNYKSYDFAAIYDDLDGMDIVRPENGIGDIDRVTFSLYTDSKTRVYLYAYMKDGATTTPTYLYGEVSGNMTLVSGNKYQYKGPSFMPNGLHQLQTVTLGDGAGATSQIIFCPLSWVRLYVTNASNVARQNFCAALYWYNQAAVAY